MAQLVTFIIVNVSSLHAPAVDTSQFSQTCFDMSELDKIDIVGM